MDPVADIKARLPIEDLVGQYCKLEKRGRGFRALCPFHNDKKPSFLISPDKGIAYCFACQKGGDIFSVYQLIEGVDFPQAIRDLAERTGVTLPERTGPVGPKRDEKERMRDCLEVALSFYRRTLEQSPDVKAYLEKRGLTPEQIADFELGVAPDSFSATYDHLLKQEFSRTEIVACGLAAQKDLSDQKAYDRFRHRLMVPIRDLQGRLIGFGGRTLGNDDAKYVNTSETPLYRKSEVLFNIQRAKEAMRLTKRAVLVEGYFDVFACERVGIHHAVACCGTALTEEHVRILKRTVDTVILCLDSDRAGREAAERAFYALSAQDVAVQAVTLPEKDPADLAQDNPALLKQLLDDGGLPYLDLVLEEIAAQDLAQATVRRGALQRLMPLLRAVRSAVERDRLLQKAAGVFGTTQTALQSDLDQVQVPTRHQPAPMPEVAGSPACTKVEMALILFLFHPQFLPQLKQLIAPDEGLSARLYQALEKHQGTEAPDIDALGLPDDELQRLKVLMLYWEESGFREWSEGAAAREIRKQCLAANAELLKQGKIAGIAKGLREASRSGRVVDEEQLKTQFTQVTKLAKLSS